MIYYVRCLPGLGQSFRVSDRAVHAGLEWAPERCESFRKLGVPYLGVLIIGILLFRELY